MNNSDANKLVPQDDEPLFTSISSEDPQLAAAYAESSRSLPQFIELIRGGRKAIYSAKLKFRDPEESERLGENRFVYIWLTNVHYYAAERAFSASFFEVPPELHQWHQVGQRLVFQGDDIFDWMVLSEDGRLVGGHTLRVTRSKLPEGERAQFDSYVGVKVYEPVE